VVSGSVADYCATFPNQTSLTVKGIHYLQESSGPQIGAAVADFVRNLRTAKNFKEYNTQKQGP
jgi:haloalkane dehalogenase